MCVCFPGVVLNLVRTFYAIREINHSIYLVCRPTGPALGGAGPNWVGPGSQLTCTKVCRIGRGAQLGIIGPIGLRPALGIYIYIYQWRRKATKSVCVWWGGGGGGAHRHVIYVPLVKNQYKRVVFGYMVIY